VNASLIYDTTSQKIVHGPGTLECMKFYNTNDACSLISNSNGTYRTLQHPVETQEPCCLDPFLAQIHSPPRDWASRGDVTYLGTVIEDYSKELAHHWGWPSTGNCTKQGTSSDSGCHQYFERVSDGLPILFSFPAGRGLQDFHFLPGTMKVGPVQKPDVAPKCQALQCPKSAAASSRPWQVTQWGPWSRI